MKRDTNHSEHFCCGRNILRLPHADEFAQFHKKLFLIRLQSWLVVAVPIIRCCFDGKGVQERANACGIVGWRQEDSLRNTRTTRLEVLKW